MVYHLGSPYGRNLQEKFLFGCFFLFKKSTPVACQPNISLNGGGLDPTSALKLLLWLFSTRTHKFLFLQVEEQVLF